MTQQKAKKRIAELELRINAIVKELNFSLSSIESCKKAIKYYNSYTKKLKLNLLAAQQEIRLLNSKGNLFKELDKHLRKEKK